MKKILENKILNYFFLLSMSIIVIALVIWFGVFLDFGYAPVYASPNSFWMNMGFTLIFLGCILGMIVSLLDMKIKQKG